MAIPDTMLTSDLRLLLAGGRDPIDFCTTPIEFSTVTNCSLYPELSRSVLPRHGRIMPIFPVIRWDRLGLVEIWTVSEQFLIASEVAFVSDIADMKFPPIERKTLASRCNILLTASTESSPLVWRF